MPLLQRCSVKKLRANTSNDDGSNDDDSRGDRRTSDGEGGHWKPERVVIIEFHDMDALDAFYNSPEHQPLIALRKSCTGDQDMLFVLEGA